MEFEEFKKQYHISLNPQQEMAVQTTEGPILLLAVPGSGKTTVLITRLGYMVYCKNVPPERILTMTYTVSATRDMRERFSAVFGEDMGNRLEFRTINGVSQKIISRYESFTGGKAFDLVSDEKKLNVLVGQIIRSIRHGFPQESDIKSARTAITYIKNMMLKEKEIAKLKLDVPDIDKIYKAYDGELKRQGLMDFDDQMVYAHMILRKIPEILAWFQKQYDYICVDEAQDTSKIQHYIIQLLAYENDNLFMVGDEDQSIYGFRAAYPEALANFAQDYQDAKILYLEQNYRSTGNIVKAASKFISRNTKRHAKNMSTEREAGGEIIRKRFSKRQEQYEFLCGVAAENPKDSAVLYRDNESALPLVNQFIHKGIPYCCRQLNTAFFTHKTVNEVCDVIDFAYAPKDTETFMRIYGRLNCFIKKEEATEAVRIAEERNIHVLNALLTLYKGQPWRVYKVNELKDNLSQIAWSDNISAALNVLTDKIGYTAADDTETKGSVKLYTLKALAEQTKVRPNRFRANLESLCSAIEKNRTKEGEGLILSTIHASKGLEYDSVYLIDSVDGTFPCVPEPGPKEDVSAWEEERRVFYVAMTRAKNSLTVFSYKDSPSCFVSEIFEERQAGVKGKLCKTPVDPFAMKDFDAETEYNLVAHGQTLIHRRYGAGRVLNKAISKDRTDVNLTVDFKGKIKELSLRMLKAANLLEIK